MKFVTLSASLLVAAIFFSPLANAQSIDDYRTHVTTINGFWSEVANWEVYTVSGWAPASTTPTSANGIITVRNGDSIRINSPVNIDQVLVESGGILGMYGTSPTSITLDNVIGEDDILVNGKLYIGAHAILTGTGSVQINNGAILVLRNSATLEVPAVNDGNMVIENTITIQNTTLTNNNTITWNDLNINLNNAVINNNGNFILSAPEFPSTELRVYITGTGTINNSGTGVIAPLSLADTFRVNTGVAFNNAGKLSGQGFYYIPTFNSNTGIIEPAHPGILSINPRSVSAHTPAINLSVSSTGAVAGTNYDQLIFSEGQFPPNITGTTLNVTDNGNDPIGTVYTIISAPFGYTGTFANVNLSPTLTGPAYLGASITVTKSSVLPVRWGSFTATARNTYAEISWSTIQEINTSYFDIERSANGADFTTIAKVTAKGNSAEKTSYNYIDNNASLHSKNYYRIHQVDIDGKGSYSSIKIVAFDSKEITNMVAAPNPVTNELQLSIQGKQVTVTVVSMNGSLIYSWPLQPGIHKLNVDHLLPGVYQLNVYDKNQKIQGQKILKL